MHDASGLQAPVSELVPRDRYDRLIAYYENAGPDYGAWSRGFNMHFGYYRRGLNPFDRESMLDEMNRQVLSRLGISGQRDGLIVDLGCGVGATVRTAAAMFRFTRILGITVVPWQIETGNAWNRRVGVYPRARLELGDYTDTGFAPESVDGAVAIESACHAEGPDKLPFLREAARILKPGARLAVADAFLKNPASRLDPASGWIHQTLSRSFVLPQLGQIESFASALERVGFDRVTVEDISWRVAPSVVYAPFIVSSFVLRKFFRRQPFGEHTINHLRGSLLCAFLGLNRLKFGYYLVSARRK
jgi:MPBQ/MSBQ methyltransferase